MAGSKILVCDDEHHIVHVVATKLRNAGFEIIAAADGEEAFEAACNDPPDLVITDYQMPFLSGLELCVKLRAEPCTRAVPIIMLTARGFSMSQEDLEGTNIQKVLPKPFSPRELLGIVRTILEAVPAVSGTVARG